MKHYKGDWSYNKVPSYIRYNGKQYYERIYVHKDGYKIKKINSNYFFLNGPLKSMKISSRATLDLTMEVTLDYGVAGKCENKKEINDYVKSLPNELIDTINTFVIQDGVDVIEAIKMSKALFGFEDNISLEKVLKVNKKRYS